MAVDPVCGMKVDESVGIKAEFGGKTYYFCSHHCKQSFEREPEKYVEKGCCSHH